MDEAWLRMRVGVLTAHGWQRVKQELDFGALSLSHHFACGLLHR
jgi:hypothetical protein